MDCHFLRNNIDRLLLATDLGLVIQESRFRDTCYPKLFSVNKFALTGLSKTDSVNAIDTCPHDPTIFLAGQESGILSLYSTKHATALTTWQLGAPIIKIEWSPHRPSVFLVLDSGGNISVFDLLENDSEPQDVVAPWVLSSKNSGSDRLPCHVRMSPTAVSAASHASLANLVAASSRGATMVIGFNDGSVQVHSVDANMAEMTVDEDKHFAEYIERLYDTSR